MSTIWVPNKKCFCPLCDEPFKKMNIMFHGKQIAADVCRTCRIFTFEFDAAYDKWRDTDKVIPCPHCATSLKWFTRYYDGFFKAVCPNPSCNTVLEKDSDVRINKKGELELDDFEADAPSEEFDIQIPVDHLKLPGTMKDDLKNKIRRNKEKGL